MMTTTHVYRGFVFTITYRVEEPGYIVRYADIPEIITNGATSVSYTHLTLPTNREV